MSKITKPLMVYIPDTRGVVVERRYGRGNLKIGPNVFTYSKLPGKAGQFALGLIGEGQPATHADRDVHGGTCPGATDYCQSVCYARRPVFEQGVVFDMWELNTMAGAHVPPIPNDAKLLRIHVSGDFDTPEYIDAWVARLTERPDVRAWAYTRSWRVESLLPALERLRALPNMQLFASMEHLGDISLLPPAGWRMAWIAPKGSEPPRNHGVLIEAGDGDGYVAWSFLCPEETGHVQNCEQCGYCIEGTSKDVTFLEH